MDSTIANLENYSFDEWVDFIFGQEIERLFNAMIYTGYKCNNIVVVQYMTRLFENADILLQRYDLWQIEAGFQFMPGIDGFCVLIYDQDVPWILRENCVKAMYTLFTEFYGKHELLKGGWAFAIWWDCIFSYCGYGDYELIQEPRLVKLMYSIIKAMEYSGIPKLDRVVAEGMDHVMPFIRALDIDVTQIPAFTKGK